MSRLESRGVLVTGAGRGVRRFTAPADVPDAVLFPPSDEARSTPGADLDVSTGRTMH